MLDDLAISPEVAAPDRPIAEQRIRWPHGPVCPHCGGAKNSYTIAPNPARKVRPGLYKCGSCRRQFAVTVNTIFHRSHISLRTWLMAFAIMCASTSHRSRAVFFRFGVSRAPASNGPVRENPPLASDHQI